VAPRRHRRRDAAVAAALQRRAGDDLGATVAEALATLRLGAEPAAIARAVGAGRSEVDAALHGLGDAVVGLGPRRLAASRWEELRERSRATLAAFHAAEPLRAGMPREEWRSRLRLPGPLGADAVHRLVATGDLVEVDGELGLPGRGRSVSASAQAAADGVVALLEARRLDPPAAAELRAAGLTPQLQRHLVESHRVVRLGPDLLLAASVHAAARERVEAHLAAHGPATVAQLRDALGATRRVVVPLLEQLDAAPAPSSSPTPWSGPASASTSPAAPPEACLPPWARPCPRPRCRSSP
ncbi:MAG: hypothetical protein E6J20_19450, partial [Chloroflexi bacterium]